jgi:hypothetical protein
MGKDNDVIKKNNNYESIVAFLNRHIFLHLPIIILRNEINAKFDFIKTTLKDLKIYFFTSV